VAGAENRLEERTKFEDREIDVVVGIDPVMARILRGPVAVPAAGTAAAAPAVAEMVEISPSGLSLTAVGAARPWPRGTPTSRPGA
jgi:hypothetical protein